MATLSTRRARKLARMRAESQTPERRREIGRNAVRTRWRRYRARKRAEAKALAEKRQRTEKAA